MGSQICLFDDAVQRVHMRYSPPGARDRGVRQRSTIIPRIYRQDKHGLATCPTYEVYSNNVELADLISIHRSNSERVPGHVSMMDR
jgi:hypothetical protein